MSNIFDKVIGKMSGELDYEDKCLLSINNECSKIVNGSGDYNHLKELLEVSLRVSFEEDTLRHYLNFVNKELLHSVRYWSEVKPEDISYSLDRLNNIYLRYTERLVSLLDFHSKYKIDYTMLKDKEYVNNILFRYHCGNCSDYEKVYNALHKYLIESKHIVDIARTWSDASRIEFFREICTWANTLQEKLNSSEFSESKIVCKFDYFKVDYMEWKVPAISNTVFINQFKAVTVDDLSVSVAPIIYLNSSDSNHVYYGLLCVYNGNIIPVFNNASIAGYLFKLFNSVEKDNDYINKLGFVKVTELTKVRAKSWKFVDVNENNDDDDDDFKCVFVHEIRYMFDDIKVYEIEHSSTPRIYARDVYGNTKDFGYLVKERFALDFIIKLLKIFGVETFYCL